MGDNYMQTTRGSVPSRSAPLGTTSVPRSDAAIDNITDDDVKSFLIGSYGAEGPVDSVTNSVRDSVGGAIDTVTGRQTPPAPRPTQMSGSGGTARPPPRAPGPGPDPVQMAGVAQAAQAQAGPPANFGPLVQYFVSIGINPDTAIKLTSKVATMEQSSPPLANGIKIQPHDAVQSLLMSKYGLRPDEARNLAQSYGQTSAAFNTMPGAGR